MDNGVTSPAKRLPESLVVVVGVVGSGKPAHAELVHVVITGWKQGGQLS